MRRTSRPCRRLLLQCCVTLRDLGEHSTKVKVKVEVNKGLVEEVIPQGLRENNRVT